MVNFFRKYHKWLGIFLILLLILFSISGIVLNHRDLLAKAEISRNHIPKDYRYVNWNNASVKEMVKLSADSVLLYGNVGIWRSDSLLRNMEDMNAGFPAGIDYRKVFKVISYRHRLYAGTLYGLYRFDVATRAWQHLPMPVKEANVVDMEVKGDSLLVLTRSHLMLSVDGARFSEVKLPTPAGYDNKVSLFKTLWVIHSGEIYGEVGKLIVDIVALVLIFLSITGLVLFFSKKKIKDKQLAAASKKKHRDAYRWNIRWHNKIGWITILFAVVTTLTGMFLRPPLLIAIASAKVGKIPFTELDTPNPWFDILRRIIYLPTEDKFVISTTEGFYYTDTEFRLLNKFDNQPPASVMGVTVLEDEGEYGLLVGSFNGLFLWDYRNGFVFDAIKREPYVRPAKAGPPVGDYKISGFGFDRGGRRVAFDYSHGVMGLEDKPDFPAMPRQILDRSPMSLWGVALEVHTGRFFSPLMGSMYILLVPLTGLFTLFVLVSGFVVWYKHYRKGRSNVKKE